MKGFSGVRRYALRLFFYNDPAPTHIYTLSLHDALPISPPQSSRRCSASTSRTSICAARFGLLVHNFQFPNFQFTLRRNPMTTGTLVAGPLPKIGRAEIGRAHV